MKAISGETLSLIADHLRRANAGEMDAAACARLLAAAFTERDPFVEVPDAPARAPGLGDTGRGRSIGAEALARLNVLLPWTSFNSLDGAGRILGSAWSGTKRGAAEPLPDKIVDKLNAALPLRGLSVLEAGCYEGHHTATLAHLAGSVWAFDGRIENVLKTLVRLWALGLERSVVVNLIDIEADPVRQQLQRLGRSDPFDLVHHRGVLYHLSKPIEHLADMASICSRHFYLHTQIARNEQANATYKSPLGEFAVFRYNEPMRSYSPFAGMTETAVWLTREGLTKLLRQLGFGQIKIIAELEQRNGLRVELIASRT